MTNLGSKSRRVYFRPTASYYELAASFTAYFWGESPAIERMQQGGALVCESPGGSPRIGLCNVCMAFNKRSDFSCLLSQKGESQNLVIRLYDKRSEKKQFKSDFMIYSPQQKYVLSNGKGVPTQYIQRGQDPSSSLATWHNSTWKADIWYFEVLEL